MFIQYFLLRELRSQNQLQVIFATHRWFKSNTKIIILITNQDENIRQNNLFKKASKGPVKS
jgi:hypothetical protein